MSYVSSSENVGFSGITQNLSEASCATQYKMAEGVSGNCNDISMFMHDGSTEDQTYLTHANDNYYHNKFKIDPNELYTFNDSDVIAGEITVSHTEDHYIFNDEVEQVEVVTNKESSISDIDIVHVNSLTNGDIKDEIEREVVTNGCYTINSTTMPSHIISKPKDEVATPNPKSKTQKTPNTKAQKSKCQGKELDRNLSVIEHRDSVHNTKNPSSNVNVAVTYASVKTSLSSVNTITTSAPATNISTAPVLSVNTGSETFLDVFKREQGLNESPPIVGNKETVTPPTLHRSTSKKALAGKTSQNKVRRGRGPAVHEALQRIPKRAIPLPNRPWHAPGYELFQCGPLDDNPRIPLAIESSSDDDLMPDIDVCVGAVCVEEMAAETRAARLALRKVALRKHVARADATLKLTGDHRHRQLLASTIQKQLRSQGAVCRLPEETVSCLLASRGLPSLLTSQERRRLRETGWSGGDSGSSYTSKFCAGERCSQKPVPCGKYCSTHVTMEPTQRLYAACSALFSGGTRCLQPLLLLQDQTPLCAEHAWKRDNYDKLLLSKPKKTATTVRKRMRPPQQRPCRRHKCRRRSTKRQAPATAPAQTNAPSGLERICSNSSAYESSEDAAMGGLSETEYMAPAAHELEVEVGQVPPDDILDPAVLSQIPDEAFTEFFNQAEGGAPFAESSELAAALEAVLDERALESIADCVFTPQQQLAKNMIQHAQASVTAHPSTPS